ncbi:MAG: hypothetical protein IPI73_10455 [Betaproteobacteria bacterium]|nr:hypothetical protein [Betaproteobacteria bacterium]
MTIDRTSTLWESVLIPGSAALLPWDMGFRRLAAHARDANLYREACEAAYAGAKTIFDIRDAEDWKRRYRLVRLVDHCDLFLVRTRSHRWLRRHVDVEGAWPTSAPFIAITFHWGAGLWSLAHLHAQGFRAHLLSAPVDRAMFHGDSVAYAYARERNRTVAIAGGAPVIYTGGASTTSGIQAIAALRRRDVVMALYDIPADPSGDKRSTLLTRVCERPVRLPAGLARIAATERAMVVPFSMGFDYRSGRRRLRIEESFVAADAQMFADRLGQSLTRLIRGDSAAWHFSALAPQFFRNEN